MSIFICGLVVGVSEIIAYPISFFIITKFRRKILIRVCYSIMAICTFCLIFVWKQSPEKTSEDDNQNDILLLALFMGFRLAVSTLYAILFVYINEVFPSQIRVPGYGIINFVGGLSMVFIPQLADMAINNNISIMAIYSAISILCIIVFKIMP